MSARIAPRIDTISIGFSPRHPKYERQYRRPDKPADAKPPHQPLAPADPAEAETKRRETLPPETLFEAALLGNDQPLTPYEVAQRLSQEWAPPASSFPLTDKTI